MLINKKNRLSPGGGYIYHSVAKQESAGHGCLPIEESNHHAASGHPSHQTRSLKNALSLFSIKLYTPRTINYLEPNSHGDSVYPIPCSSGLMMMVSKGRSLK